MNSTIINYINRIDNRQLRLIKQFIISNRTAATVILYNHQSRFISNYSNNRSIQLCTNITAANNSTTNRLLSTATTKQSKMSSSTVPNGSSESKSIDINIPVSGYPNTVIHAVKTPVNSNNNNNTNNSDNSAAAAAAAKRVLLLIHGGDAKFQNHSHWNSHLGFLSEFGTIVAVDLIGHGTSKPGDSDTTVNPMDTPLNTAAVTTLIQTDLDCIDATEIILVGRSYGCRIVDNVLYSINTSNNSDNNNNNNNKFRRAILIAPALQSTDYKPNIIKSLQSLLVLWAAEDPIVEFNRYQTVKANFPNNHQLIQFENILTPAMIANKQSYLAHMPENVQIDKFQSAVAQWINSTNNSNKSD